MDIYVISACWWRDGSTVIGAGATRVDAEAIADKYPGSDEGAASWAPWKENVNSVNAEGACRWSRDALNADGTSHASLYQEIVRVPLAGSIIHEVPIERTPWAHNALADIQDIGRAFGAP